jgi:hypothetical protein
VHVFQVDVAVGTLQFTKITRDMTIDVRVHVDRAMAERKPDNRTALATSQFLGMTKRSQRLDQLLGEARFCLTSPQIAPTLAFEASDANSAVWWRLNDGVSVRYFFQIWGLAQTQANRQKLAEASSALPGRNDAKLLPALTRPGRYFRRTPLSSPSTDFIKKCVAEPCPSRTNSIRVPAREKVVSDIGSSLCLPAPS